MTCVVNFAFGAEYENLQRRLSLTLDRVGFKGARHFWTSYAALGCPPHDVVPYAFKPYALQRALALGAELALWVDAVIYAIRPLDPIFDYLSGHSHLFFFNGNIGQWTSDACLAGFNVTRDQALNLPMLLGCCMGFNFRSPVTREFLARWVAKSQDGMSFQGSWSNTGANFGSVSSDPRCLGHRHDQSVASLLAWELGMSLVPKDDYVAYIHLERVSARAMLVSSR